MCNKLRRIRGILEAIDNPMLNHEKNEEGLKRKLSEVRHLVDCLKDSIEDEASAEYARIANV